MEPISALPDGITVEELARRIRAGQIGLQRLLGELPVFVFKPKVDEHQSPVYSTPDDGSELPEPGDTSVLQRGKGFELDTVLRTAVVVPITVTNRNLYEDRVLIGRSASCDIRLVSPLVSKLHACVMVEDEEGAGWRLADQGSSNGTRLNGIELDPKRLYRLRPNDEVLFGDVTALFLDGEGLEQLCALVPD